MSEILFEQKFPKAAIVPCEILLHLVSVATSVTEVFWDGELSFSFGPNVHGYLPTCSFSRTCTCTHSTSTTSHNMEKGRRRWVGRVGHCPPRLMQIPVKSNYLEIYQSLPGNPLATMRNPLAPIGKLPTIGKLTIEAK